MNDARGTQAGGGSLNEFQLPEAFFQSDNLLRLLGAVRGSSIPQEARAEIRDLVLAYSQLTDDAERRSTEQHIAAALQPYQDQFKALVRTDEATPAVSVRPAPERQSVFGVARPRPVFGSVTNDSGTSPVPVRKVPLEKKSEPQSLPKQEPVMKMPVEPVPPAAPPTPQQPAVAPSAPPASGMPPKERIAEIKHAVNEKVGNPVNLIEKNKAVGQEYMSALLDAIKRTSSPIGGVDAAMERLEKSYAAVLSMLRENATAPKTAAATPPPPPPLPKPAAPPPQKNVVPQPVPEVQRVRVEPRIPSPPLRTSAPKPPRQADSPMRLQSLRASLASASKRAAVPAQPEAAEVAAPKKIASAPRPEMKPPATQNDARPDSEVAAGLAQLLSEWKLFRASGIFGTGPSGIDHPLYKKLEHLPMAAVISGRFEGATPEIRQNISDYMNGWRYEQGIVHRMDEQFGDYLRRVIRHILDRQPKRAEAK